MDRRGRLHGYLLDQGKFTVIDFPGAKATFVARINAQGQIVGAYSEESNTPAFNLPHGFLLQDGVFTKIDVPGARRTQPFGINNHGQIVGEYVDAEGRSHGFLLENGVFTTIDAPGGASTIAFDINDKGQIVGISFTGSIVTGFGSAFVRDANGAFTPVAVPDSFITVPFGINNRGQVVGHYQDAAARNGHGFLLDQGVLTTIDAPDATRGTFVFDINKPGQIAGAYDLVVYGYLQDRRGDFTTIDHPDAVRLTGEPISINNRGQIAGAYTDAQGAFRGFLQDKHGFTNVDVPGALQTQPYKINDHGQVVGLFVDAKTGVQHGFLLDNSVFTTIDVPGAVLTAALDIDNHGQIAGQYLDAAGIFHGFLRDTTRRLHHHRRPRLHGDWGHRHQRPRRDRGRLRRCKRDTPGLSAGPGRRHDHQFPWRCRHPTLWYQQSRSDRGLLRRRRATTWVPAERRPVHNAQGPSGHVPGVACARPR